MAHSDNEGRRSDLSHTAPGAPDPDPLDQANRDEPEARQSDGRQWTLRRIEGVIGSIA